MLTLFFYEPDHTGHHYPYLARMLPGFVHSQVKIILATTPKGAASPEYQRFLQPLAEHFTLETDCVRRGATPFKLAWNRVTEIDRLQKKHQADHLFIAYADGVWQVHALRNLLRWVRRKPKFQMEGILYRGAFSYPGNDSKSSKIKRFLFRRLLAQGFYQRLLLDDEYLQEFAVLVGTNQPTEVELAVNPVQSFDFDRAAARKQLGLNSEGRIISLSGVIDNRKGADLLTYAFAEALERGLEDTTLLLAGPHYDDFIAVLHQPEIQRHANAGRIVSLDRLLDEQDMFSVAAASDLVTAPYPNHSGRSSIVLWAAIAGTPVLTTDRGCIGRVVRAEKLGITCDVSDQSALLAAIETGLNQPWTKHDRERAMRYGEQHSVENYRTLNSRLVRARIGHDLSN